MKKILALILTLVMVLSLVACGEKPVEPDQPEEPDTSIILQEGNEYGAPAGRVLVMYWSPYGSGTTKYVDPHIEAFNNMQDEYWVVREYNGGYYDQIAKLMATEKKDLPALVNSSSETVGSYLHSGLIKMVQDYIDADPSYDRELYAPLTATYGNEDGMIGYPIGLSLSGFFYNKTIFDKAGIDPTTLTSFDKIYEASKKLVDGGFCKYALSEEHSGIWANYAFHREGFYTVDNENASTGLPTKCLYDDNSNGFADIVKQYYTQWADLAAGGYVFPVGSSKKDELEPAMAAGDLAMMITTNSSYKRIKEACEANGMEVGFQPQYSITENGKKSGFCTSGNGMFIIDNGKTKSMQGAYEFLKYFTSVEVQLQWNQDTSYMPMYKEIYEHPDFQATLSWRPSFDQNIKDFLAGDDSAFYAFTATNNEYTLAQQTCLEAVCNGTPVDDAIAQMVSSINDAFELYNMANS